MRCFAHRFDFVSVNIVSTNLVAGSGRCFRSFVGPSPRSTRPQSTRDIDGRESELSSFCRDRVEFFTRETQVDTAYLQQILRAALCASVSRRVKPVPSWSDWIGSDAENKFDAYCATTGLLAALLARPAKLGAPQEAVINEVCVRVGSRDHSRLVDGSREGALELACASARGIERRDGARLRPIQLQATNQKDQTDYFPNLNRSFEPDFVFHVSELVAKQDLKFTFLTQELPCPVC
jgi:hypothetical protein